MSVLAAFVLVLAVAAPAGAAPPRVYIVVVDGLDASAVGDQLTPNLWRLAYGGTERTTFYPRGRSAMPAVTNTNHAAILTASYAAAHGIVENQLWDRTIGHPPQPSADACNLEVETLFTVLKKDRVGLTTAALFGKSRLAALFDDCPSRQSRPDILWADTATETEAFDARLGFASDRRTMDEALDTVARRDPDLLVVALPDVDRTEHLFGPDAPETRRAIGNVDGEIERLVELAKSRGAWSRTVLMVTADHGFRRLEVDRTSGPPYPLIVFDRALARAGVVDARVLTNGGLGFLLFSGQPPQRLDDPGATRLQQLRALALSEPGVAEAWYRLPNPADGNDAFTLARAHPEWRMEHPRGGELVLVAGPHHTFADRAGSPDVIGDHGGPDASYVPILISGGDPRIRAQVREAGGATPPAENPDLGATAAWLLDAPPPRLVSGNAVPAPLAGRILHEAFSPPGAIDR